VCESKKTLTRLYRLHESEPDPKTAADFFRESPWQVEAIAGPRKRYMLMKLLEIAQLLGLASVILVSLDDSLGKKDKATKHLEAVAYHHNHTESQGKKQVYTNGYVYVEVHVQIGSLGFLFDTRLYLREKTVRQLNRSVRPNVICTIAANMRWGGKCCSNWLTCFRKATRCTCCLTPGMLPLN